MSDKPQSFFIELAYGVHSFYVGQRIEGRVVMILSEPKRCKGVKIELRGTTIVNLSTSANTTPGSLKASQWGSTSTDFVSSHQLSLLQPGQLNAKGVLNAGRYEWPFLFETNEMASSPASFEGRHGAIRYLLRATFRRGMCASDNIALFPITIVPAVDANQAIYAVPKTVQNVRKVTAWLGWSDRGEITSEMTVPRTGFIPGDAIDVHMRLENKVTGGSKDTMKKATLIVLQKVRYTAGSSTRVTEQQISEMPLLTNGPLTKGHMLDQVFPVTLPLTAPTLTHQAMSVWYLLKFKGETSASDTPIFLEIPFTICTFRSAAYSQPQPTQAAAVEPAVYQAPPQQQQLPQPTMPMMVHQPNPATPLYSMDAPPAYEDIIADQQEDAKMANFMPSYSFIAPTAPRLYPDLAPASTTTPAQAQTTTVAQPSQQQQQQPQPMAVEPARYADLQFVTPAVVETIVAPPVPQLCVAENSCPTTATQSIAESDSWVAAPVAAAVAPEPVVVPVVAATAPPLAMNIVQPQQEQEPTEDDIEAMEEHAKPVKKTARRKAVAV